MGTPTRGREKYDSPVTSPSRPIRIRHITFGEKYPLVVLGWFASCRLSQMNRVVEDGGTNFNPDNLRLADVDSKACPSGFRGRLIPIPLY